MVRPFDDLRDVHVGMPIAVLGGGPSLWVDLDDLPGHARLVGVNYHAARIVHLDYITFLDDPEKSKRLLPHMERHTGRRVSPLSHWSDWELVNVPDFGLTSTFAAWVACLMGGDPILLCGMDCYTTGARYCHGGTMAPHPCQSYPVEIHIDTWRRAATHFARPEAIRAVSGPLVNVFGKYDA